MDVTGGGPDGARDQSGPRKIEARDSSEVLRADDAHDASSATIVSARRVHDVEERRTAMRRLWLVGTIAWPLWFFVDLLLASTMGRLDALAWLTALRAGGWVLILASYALLARVRLSGRALAILDMGLFALGSGIVSMQALKLGGLESRLLLGVATLAFLRASLLPSHWTRTALVTATILLVFPAVMLVASKLDPAVDAQWSSPRILGAFAFDFAALAFAIGICTAGGHLVWSARRQVREARKLGSYRLKARIGAGGNGDVWLARQDPLGRSVALKVLKESGKADEDSIRRFEREAKAASRLRHPNTIRIIEFGASDDGVLFIAMELLDGLDLDTLVNIAGPLAPSRVIHFARQACGSLAEAHEAGIVHRDIKPGNFFVTRVADERDFLKLLDFGVARVAQGAKASSLTAAGILFGTPAYMPPEVCSGEVAEPRSDIYSLGAVLYFMLTGTSLFPGRTFNETVMSHVTKVPESPSERRGEPVPADLERIVLKCLAKSPELRFQSVRELEAALATCEDAEKWSASDAAAWWTSLRSSVVMRARGAA